MVDRLPVLCSRLTLAAVVLGSSACRGEQRPDGPILCNADRDCPPTMVCRQGECALAPVVHCATHEECVTPGDCEELAGARCVGGACDYPTAKPAGTVCPLPSRCALSAACDGRGRCLAVSKVCGEPPADSCNPEDTLYRAYVDSGVCAPVTGECEYGFVDIPCAGCTANCLAQCAPVSCSENAGGCRYNGICIPGVAPRCEYDHAADGTPCDLPGSAVGSFDGQCLAGACEDFAYTPGSCGLIPNGGTESRECYLTATVPHGATCPSVQQARVCRDGAWSPDWAPCGFPTCAPESGVATGAISYTKPGSSQVIIPPEITSVSVVCIGSGGNGYNTYYPAWGGGGGGGALSYGTVAVTPGETLEVQVGGSGGGSSVARLSTPLVLALGGQAGDYSTSGEGGSAAGGVGAVTFSGGRGSGGRGGGAAGYAGDGGTGGSIPDPNTGAAAGGDLINWQYTTSHEEPDDGLVNGYYMRGGGGVGLFGPGATAAALGGGGSGGADSVTHADPYDIVSSTPGGAFGGGGSGGGTSWDTYYAWRVDGSGSAGAGGAVRIVLGPDRYPSSAGSLEAQELVRSDAGPSTWIVPDGVYSISVLVIGGGGGGRTDETWGNGGGGGGLRYYNDLFVTPGQELALYVGAAGAGGLAPTHGGDTWFGGSGTGDAIVWAGGGQCGQPGGVDAAGGTGSPIGGPIGGGDGGKSNFANDAVQASNGGGAGGYSGAGGNGRSQGVTGTAGSGGGGGTVTTLGTGTGYAGGGVGIGGQKENGRYASSTSDVAGSGGSGSAFGGGGAGRDNAGDVEAQQNGGGGVIRIIWPGTRRFPYFAGN